MQKEQFFRLKKNDMSWRKIMKMVAYRKFRQLGDDIEPTPMYQVRMRNFAEFKKTGDPDLLELLMGPRKYQNGKIKPYTEHPIYLKKLE